MPINCSIIAKMFEEKVNSPLRGEVKKLLAKKIPSLFCDSIFNFLLVNNLSKKWCVIEAICGKFGLFKGQESFAHAICGKLMVETFQYVLVHKSCFVFQKIDFMGFCPN